MARLPLASSELLQRREVLKGEQSRTTGGLKRVYPSLTGSYASSKTGCDKKMP